MKQIINIFLVSLLVMTSSLYSVHAVATNEQSTPGTLEKALYGATKEKVSELREKLSSTTIGKHKIIHIKGSKLNSIFEKIAILLVKKDFNKEKNVRLFETLNKVIVYSAINELPNIKQEVKERNQISLKKAVKSLVSDYKDYTKKKLLPVKKETIQERINRLNNRNKLNNKHNKTNKILKKDNYENVTITVIDDKRCSNCATENIVDQLVLLPSISEVEIINKDFSDEGVADYLKENNITALPLIVFSTNNFDVSKDPSVDLGGQITPKVNTFLEALPNGEFSLLIGSTFNPFQVRSERGYLQLDKETLEKLKANTHIKGAEDAKITWFEYSDLKCPYCARLSNQGTDTYLLEKYANDINISFKHFPIGMNEQSRVGAELLECIGEEKGSDAFYSLMKKIFEEKNTSKSFIIKEAVVLGASEDKMNECLDSGKYIEKIENQMNTGVRVFGITGTPGNVLINNQTGEYEIIPGAYPTSEFIKVIDKLLKK